MAEKEYIVEGYKFSTVAEAKKAQKEAEAIVFIKERIKNLSTEKKIEIYKKIVADNMLVTPVGKDYLNELEEELGLNADKIKKEDEAFKRQVTKIRQESKITDQSKKIKKELGNYKIKYRNSIIINVILVIAIIAMFVLIQTSNNINILNYKDKVVNQYEEWQKNLEEREERIIEYEKKYNINSGDRYEKN